MYVHVHTIDTHDPTLQFTSKSMNMPGKLNGVSGCTQIYRNNYNTTDRCVNINTLRISTAMNTIGESSRICIHS